MSDNGEAKKKHDIEQGLASFVVIGAGFARMLKAMKDEGTPSKEAVTIVASYARGFTTRSAGGDG